MNNLTLDDIVVFVYAWGECDSRARTVRDTWARGIPHVHYVAHRDLGFPGSVALGPEAHKNTPQKTFLMWQYAFKKYGLSKKWFIKIDDDAYLNTENLLKVLAGCDHDKEWYLGDLDGARQLEGRESVCWLPGGMYILSRKCLERLSAFLNTPEGRAVFWDNGCRGEDVKVGTAMDLLHIYPTSCPGAYQELDARVLKNKRGWVSIHRILRKEIILLYVIRQFRWPALNTIFLLVYFAIVRVRHSRFYKLLLMCYDRFMK